MIGRVKALLGLEAGTPEPESTAEDELREAAACILVEASLIDGHVDEREIAHLTDVLANHFALERAAAERLVARANEIARDSVDWNRFTRVIKAEFDAEERVAMMEMLWLVVLADGELHAYEDSLVRRIAGLLHVEDGDRALARRRAEAKLARA
ncbi:MAG: TerB family tellurite resistance protein [Rhodospirillales bacterium]|nr:TerB family tellurite resistance protein [Rhodospirillales bacterium]